MRCNTHFLGNIPAACDSKGTEESVNAVTPKSLYEMLNFIIKKCPVEAVFAGKFNKKTEETLLTLLSAIAAKRTEDDIIPCPKLVKPSFGDKVLNVTEDISANQGRMVMGFHVMRSGEDTAPYEVFNDIFGGSPVSRLFTNVRERLQLCYYCSSAQNLNLDVMYVRSGINPENTELAKGEILSQLESLKFPESISDEELSAAKTGILSAYKTTCDGLTQYASWYTNRRISGRHTDIERCIEAVSKVDKAAVSAVARGIKPVINYFLNGTEKG